MLFTMKYGIPSAKYRVGIHFHGLFVFFIVHDFRFLYKLEMTLAGVFYDKCGLRSDYGSIRNLERLACKHVNASLETLGDL